MKPRKTRKYSKKSENTFASDARDEIRGERKVKEFTIENIIPMEHSYASKVKGQSNEQGKFSFPEQFCCKDYEHR